MDGEVDLELTGQQSSRGSVSGTGCSWRPLTGSVPKGSTLGPVFFYLLISNLDEGADAFLAKLGAVADPAEACAAPQMDFDWLERWAEKGRSHQYLQVFEEKVPRGWRQALLSGAQEQDKRQ